MPVSCHSPNVRKNEGYYVLDEDGVTDLSKMICLSMRPCQQCGKLIACLWTPAGVEPPRSCAEHQ